MRAELRAREGDARRALEGYEGVEGMGEIVRRYRGLVGEGRGVREQVGRLRGGEG